MLESVFISQTFLYSLFPSLPKPRMCICENDGQLQCETDSLRNCYGMTRITTHRNQAQSCSEDSKEIMIVIKH